MTAPRVHLRHGDLRGADLTARCVCGVAACIGPTTRKPLRVNGAPRTWNCNPPEIPIQSSCHTDTD